MIILIGVIGFVGGFCAGQLFLMFMLRHKTNEDLKTDRSLRFYGFLNWVIAGIGAAVFISIYRKYFG